MFFHVPKYFCPKHGDQGPYIGIELAISSVSEPLPESLKSRAGRRYCMACWVDLMDREMEQLVEVTPSSNEEVYTALIGVSPVALPEGFCPSVTAASLGEARAKFRTYLVEAGLDGDIADTCSFATKYIQFEPNGKSL